jgi:hypothetical protein
MTTTALNIDLGFSPHNIEGYPDPTAFKALKNLQRAEYGYRPLVYICSPYYRDIDSNVELARALCAHAVSRHKIPLAPHLLFQQFMDDADASDRVLAMFFNRILLSKCEAIWVYTGRVSAGMRAEIEWARHLELPITYFDADFEEVTL